MIFGDLPEDVAKVLLVEVPVCDHDWWMIKASERSSRTWTDVLVLMLPSGFFRN